MSQPSPPIVAIEVPESLLTTDELKDLRRRAEAAGMHDVARRLAMWLDRRMIRDGAK